MGIVAAKRGVPCVLRRLARRPANSRCARWYVGRYDEVRRNMYATEMFENATKDIDGYAGIRDVHIGLDIGGPAGTPVYAPAEGVIQSFGYNPKAGDYGHVIVTEHVIEGVRCWMLFGHLDAASVAFKRVGQVVERGERRERSARTRKWGLGAARALPSRSSRPRRTTCPASSPPRSATARAPDYPDPRLIAGMLRGTRRCCPSAAALHTPISRPKSSKRRDAPEADPAVHRAARPPAARPARRARLEGPDDDEVAARTR